MAEAAFREGGRAETRAKQAAADVRTGPRNVMRNTPTGGVLKERQRRCEGRCGGGIGTGVERRDGIGGRGRGGRRPKRATTSARGRGDEGRTKKGEGGGNGKERRRRGRTTEKNTKKQRGRYRQNTHSKRGIGADEPAPKASGRGAEPVNCARRSARKKQMRGVGGTRWRRKDDQGAAVPRPARDGAWGATAFGHKPVIARGGELPRRNGPLTGHLSAI